MKKPPQPSEKDIQKVPSNHKFAELIAPDCISEGQFSVDGDGHIWRHWYWHKVGIKHWASIKKIYLQKPRRAEQKNKSGYLSVAMFFEGITRRPLAHRVVWQYFNGLIPKGLTINHKNGIKDDNRPSNLELATYSEQRFHALRELGCKNSTQVLSIEQAILIKQRLSNGGHPRSVHKDYLQVSLGEIKAIKGGYSWQRA